MLTVQISVSWMVVGLARTFFLIKVVGYGETYRLQVLLDLGVQGAGLEGNDLRGRIRVVGNGRAALRAEDPVNLVTGSTRASVALGGSLDGQLVLGDDGDEGWERR